MKTIWPFRHFGLKVLSLLLALFLWLGVSGEEVVERALRVPLELQQFPVGLELRGEWPTFVDVRVRGSSGVLSRVSAGDVVAILDLRSAKIGPRIFQLTPDQVRTPFGVQSVQVTPSAVGLTFERSKTRRVPVKPILEGELEPGYVVGRVTVEPATVEVIGPATLVDQVSEAVTEAVSVAGAHAEITERVTVGFVESALRLVAPQPAFVRVQVLPGPAERTLSDRAIHLRNLGPNLAAQAVPAVTTVVLRGSRQTLSHFDASAVAAYVDLSRLGVGEYTLRVQVDTSQDVGVTRIEPNAVRVTIAKN